MPSFDGNFDWQRREQNVGNTRAFSTCNIFTRILVFIPNISRCFLH